MNYLAMLIDHIAWSTEAKLQIAIAKYIRVENPTLAKSGAVRWMPVPKGERVELRSFGKAGKVDGASGEVTRHLFQIAHLDGVSRTSRVTFMGQFFRVIHVSQASRLHGLELQCEAIRD